MKKNENPKKCKNEECILKTKCINYKFGTGLNWSYDPTKCNNYSKFESIETKEKEYQERKINEFLTKNGLEDERLWSKEDEDKIINFLNELKKEIISNKINNISSHICKK